MYMENT